MKPAKHYPISEVPSIVEPVVHLLEGVTRDLLGGDKPVSVTVSEGGAVIRFVVRVAPEHLDTLIGSEGRTAESLCVIVRAAGIKNGLSFDLVIDAEPDTDLEAASFSLPGTSASWLSAPKSRN